MNLLAYIVAAFVFALAALGVSPGSVTELDVIAVGLAVFAVAHILPPR